MINVTYNRRETTLTVKGHAQSAPKGQDLVCAAASTLAFTAAEALRDEAERFYPSVVQRPGELRITCEPASGSRKACRRLLDTIWVGFEILANEYPDYVRSKRED